MKKVLALLLCLALCISMTACGNSEEAPAASPTTPVIPVSEPAEDEVETVEPEATDPVESLTLYTLTPKQADEYYQAIMNGEVSSEGAEFIKTLDETTAKYYLDALANIFGDDVLGTLSSFSGQELDQVMTEVAYIVGERNTPAQEEESAPMDEALMEAAYNGTANTLELYNRDLSRRVYIEFDLNHVYLEPDWVLMRDESTNYFISLDHAGEVFTLDYRTESASTQEIMQSWGAQYATDGQVRVGKVDPFLAGGVEWELFAYVYEKESSGINKETGALETSVSTVYTPVCFARLDNETILQLNTGTFVSEDVFDYYIDLLQTCIESITISVG